MKSKSRITRRTALKQLGLAGVLAAPLTSNAAQTEPGPPPTTSQGHVPFPRTARQALVEQVNATPLIDTHEHLVEEAERLQGKPTSRIPCDDWALLFSHYLNSDLLVAGMPKAAMTRFLSPEPDPVAKWRELAPFWPFVKNTGYAQAVRIAVQELYGVAEIQEDTVAAVQRGYERVRRPGFYEEVLRRKARIESCQVNCLTGEPFKESAQPRLLMQDLSIVGMFAGPNIGQYAPPTGINVTSLNDWHKVMGWWFDRYAKVAVAVKSQHAYGRDIDYARVPAEKAEPVFAKILRKDPVSPEDRRALEDHLFWHAVDLATRHELPVKLHTGYYAGNNSMPLSRLIKNAGSAAELCRLSPDTRFVFMHICYPFYEELLSVVKQWSNAYVDMCWSWIINPAAAKDYLKKHIVTAPINKLLPFGGDYIPVEPVVGHAAMARRGIAQALAELVEEGWLSLADAMNLVDPILHENARRIFQLDAKLKALA
jgi:hypothetical protein